MAEVEVKKIYNEQGDWDLCECEVGGTRVVRVLGSLKAGEKRMYTITIAPTRRFHEEEVIELKFELSDNQMCQLVDDIYESVEDEEGAA